MATLTIILKDSERKYIKKFLVYESFTCDPSDKVILDAISEAKSEFKGDIEDIQVKISLEV